MVSRTGVLVLERTQSYTVKDKAIRPLEAVEGVHQTDACLSLRRQ